MLRGMEHGIQYNTLHLGQVREGLAGDDAHETGRSGYLRVENITFARGFVHDGSGSIFSSKKNHASMSYAYSTTRGEGGGAWQRCSHCLCITHPLRTRTSVTLGTHLGQ
jgi:hypothetical protein